jgi:hypothetical protein
MKKLLVLLFSLFFLSSPSVFADDISDFEIEGISIGDSLLDYMTEEEILEEVEYRKDWYSHLNEPNKYVEVYKWKDLSTYDALSFIIKNTSTSQYLSNKNEKYIIQSIFGRTVFTEDFVGCIQKRNEIEKEIAQIFSNTQRYEDILKHSVDPSGRSIIDSVYFEFDSGAIAELSCYDYEETLRISNNWYDILVVGIRSKEVRSWLNN